MMKLGHILSMLRPALAFQYIAAHGALFPLNLRPAERSKLIIWPSSQFEFETPDLMG